MIKKKKLAERLGLKLQAKKYIRDSRVRGKLKKRTHFHSFKDIVFIAMIVYKLKSSFEIENRETLQNIFYWNYYFLDAKVVIRI